MNIEICSILSLSLSLSVYIYIYIYTYIEIWPNKDSKISSIAKSISNKDSLNKDGFNKGCSSKGGAVGGRCSEWG